MALAWSKDDIRRARAMLPILTLDFQDSAKGECWGDVLEGWQVRVYEAALGFPSNPAGDRSKVEVCGVVGCGKDQLLAALCLAIARYAPEGTQAIVYSIDKDKTREITETVGDFVFRQRELKEGIEIVGRAMTNARRNIRILFEASDGASASGVRYDYAFMNEIQEWDRTAHRRVYKHVTARRGKRDGRLVVFSNAPYTEKGEWRRDRWEKAKRRDSDWYYVPVRVKDAPWTREAAAEAKANLHGIEYRRLYGLKPGAGREEVVSAAEVAFAEGACGALGLYPDPERRGKRFIGMDLGIKHDHAVVCMLCATPGGEVFLEELRVWVPGGAEPVRLDDVEQFVMGLAKPYHAVLYPDPWQAEQMLQHFERAGIEIERVNAQGRVRHRMVHAVMNLFREKRLRMPRGAGVVTVNGEETSLRQQILGCGVKRSGHGLVFDIESTKAGHFDQLIAFSMAALGVSQHGFESEAEAADPDEGELRRAPTGPGSELRKRTVRGRGGRRGRENVYLHAGRSRENWRRYA